MDKIKVVMVDDHELFREGIELLLNIQDHIELLASVPNERKLLEYLKVGVTPDIYLLDINLPGVSGIEIARGLFQSNGKIGVIFLTSNVAKNFIDAALKTGARGFLTKECTKKELITAIESVANGQYYFGKNIEQSLYDGYVKQLVRFGDEFELTEREVQVLRSFANGSTYMEVADELSISKKTVEAHKKAIYEKLQLKNQTDLVKYAIKHHIIEL